jgi:hypothetical protein
MLDDQDTGLDPAVRHSGLKGYFTPNPNGISGGNTFVRYNSGAGTDALAVPAKPNRKDHFDAQVLTRSDVYT